jgi:hypothetical protein
MEDPLAHVRACALNVLEHLTTDAQCQRVFEICCHKVEYVDEMVQVRQRHIEARNNCLKHMERGLRNAAKKGLLASAVNPRLAAVGLHALVDGLIVELGCWIRGICPWRATQRRWWTNISTASGPDPRNLRHDAQSPCVARARRGQGG